MFIDHEPAADLTEPLPDPEPSVVTPQDIQRGVVQSTVDRMLDLLRHPHATLNPDMWRRAVDEFEAWVRHVEDRLAGR